MKKIITLLASAALVASSLSILPAYAAEDEPTQIPEVVNIEDPAGDGNALNDQGAGQGVGDNPTPASVGAADVLKGWFANDTETLSLHINTTLPPPNSVFGLFYRTFVDEIEGCTNFDIAIPSVTYVGDAFAELVCGDAAVVGEVKVETLEDGTGIVTGTFKRADSLAFATGATLAAPQIYVRGHEGTSETGGLITPVFDSTAEGTDYTVTAGVTKAKKKTPGKNNPPGKKKGCKKGKGKKRGCEGKGKKSPKRGKPVAACGAMEPADAGVDAPTVKVTDAHNAEAPLVQPIELEQKFDEGLMSDAVPTSVNVQVDSKLKEVGLYAMLEFPTRRDYDLWAYFPGSPNEEAASSHGFNPLAETQGINDDPDPSNTASNHGGETTATSETLVGILTPDCGGYTISAYNWLGEGGELELKLWLGEVGYDPAETPPARSIYDSVQSLI